MSDTQENAFKNSYFLNFLTSAILTIPLYVQVLGFTFGNNRSLPIWLQIGLATLVQFGCGSAILFAPRKVNGDIPYFLATATAYFFSLLTYFLGWRYPLFFDLTAIAMTLVLLQKWVKFMAIKQSKIALENLIQKVPKEAHIEKEQQLFTIPIEEVQRNNVIIVNPGEVIPVDGEVIEGRSLVNEGMLTGENISIEKRVGDRVYASTLNRGSILKILATNIGKDTNLSKMIQLLTTSTFSAVTKSQKTLATLNAFFPILIIFIALCTFLGWMLFGSHTLQAITSSISVLLVATPIAYGLGVAILIEVARGRGAQMGILYTSFDSLEKAGRVHSLVIDKTGSLTEGRPHVKGVYSYGNYHDTDIITVAASIEHYSQHPIGKAIVAFALEQDIPIEPATEFAHIKGKGVYGFKRGKRYYVGSLRMLKEHFSTLPEYIQKYEVPDCVCFVWNETELMGYFIITDRLKRNCPQAIYNLHEMGVRTIMITGDDYQKALYVSHEAQIEEFYSGIKPEEKPLEVLKLKSPKRMIGVVADVTNDAAALAASDLGFAIITGSDMPLVINDIALMRNDLIAVVDAIQLSKTTLQRCIQNLSFLTIYNLIGIVLAACGILTPYAAVIAMTVVSIGVLYYSLTLSKWKPSITL